MKVRLRLAEENSEGMIGLEGPGRLALISATRAEDIPKGETSLASRGSAEGSALGDARKGPANDRRSSGDGPDGRRSRRPRLPRRLGATMTVARGRTCNGADLARSSCYSDADYDEF